MEKRLTAGAVFFVAADFFRVGAAAFMGAAGFSGRAAVFLIVVAFAMGLEVVVVALDFLGCGASDSSSAFLFLPVDLAAVAFVLAAVGFGLAVLVLGFADLGCFFAAGLAVVTLVLFVFGSSSDSSALRLLPLGLVVVGWAIAGGVGVLRARIEARVGAGAAPASAASLRGMLTDYAQRVQDL